MAPEIKLHLCPLNHLGVELVAPLTRAYVRSRIGHTRSPSSLIGRRRRRDWRNRGGRRRGEGRRRRRGGKMRWAGGREEGGREERRDEVGGRG